MNPHNDDKEHLRKFALQQGPVISQPRRLPESTPGEPSDLMRATLGMVADGVIGIDRAGCVSFMNIVAERLTGWSPAAAMGQPLSAVIRSKSVPNRQSAEELALKALQSGNAEERIGPSILITKDGRELPVEGSAGPIRSSDGTVTGAVLVFRDISDRQHAAEVLRASKAQSEFQRRVYEAILTNTPDLAYVFDLQCRFTYANESLLKMWGLTWEQAIGKTCLELGYEPWHAEMHDREIAQVAATKQPIRGEVPFTGTFGTRIYDYIMVPVLDENGEVSAVAGTTRDVTERSQAELAIAKLAAIVESSDDAIVSRALDGIITSWNRSAEKMYGYSAEEAIGRHISLIVPAERRSEEDEVLARLKCGERIDHFVTERQAKDGHRLSISLTVSPIRDSAGNVIGASKIARDITEQKRAEAERDALLASERFARAEAERASKIKEEFLATLSHELRTPLSAILGWVQLLQRKSPDRETLEQGLTVIDRNARMQEQLIADLLDMSRIISGKMRMDVQPVELKVVIKSALETVRPAADAKGIRLQTMLDPGTALVNGDPTRLQQVVWNLLSNAVKFSPRGSRIQVILARVNSHVEITVSDTGQGIKPEFLPYVFDRFRQADSSAARVHGGLGLGLSIVKQLVELHGGSVHVASEGEGRGSTFSVHLPIAILHASPVAEERVHPTSPPHVSVHVAAPNLAGVRVLVVDDDADARELIRRVLEDCGAEVNVVRSVEEALAAVRQSEPDVIVSDIGMPGRDGYELMKSLRRSGLKTPAAALTAFARSEDRTRALSAGFHTHIAKPVSPAELLAAVEALAHKTSVGESG